MPEFSLVQRLLLMGIPLLFSLTLHEVAHGWAAYALGDRTGLMLGRLTLNPVKNVDPIGIVIPVVMILLRLPFLFGWAKPMPVDARNFKNPRTGMAWVAFAGLSSYLVMALTWVAIAWVAYTLGQQVPYVIPLCWMAVFGVIVNSSLFVFNVIPLPPFDGGRLLAGLLPTRPAYRLYQMEPYSGILILILLLTGVASLIFIPLIQYVATCFLTLMPHQMLVMP